MSFTLSFISHVWSHKAIYITFLIIILCSLLLPLFFAIFAFLQKKNMTYKFKENLNKEMKKHNKIRGFHTEQWGFGSGSLLWPNHGLRHCMSIFLLTVIRVKNVFILPAVVYINFPY